MAKARLNYTCEACRYVAPQWMGKCPQCGEWNTFIEEVQAGGKVSLISERKSVPIALDRIEPGDVSRKATGIAEFDRVLGGGVVPGSFILLGGDPGVGKSTIMLQMSQVLAESGCRIFYVSGEESAGQLKMRGMRLGVDSANIIVYTDVVLDNLKAELKAARADILIIDSIQSVYSSQVDAPPGSVSQIRHCAGLFMEFAKGLNIPVFVIGHVTKDGWIAGPKMLEHMVDTVVYFENHESGAYRVLRTVKNRFGPVGEIGVFEMQERGLVEVGDPSGIFIHGLGGEFSGTAVMSTIEGSRSFLIEIQSLVTKTSFSQPRRISIGIDQSKVSVLLAVMEKRAGIFLSSSDVVVNVAGGIKVQEPAIDLAIIMSLASSAMDRTLPTGMICMGEVGLNGEVRPVSHVELRLREAARMGFTKVVLASDNAAAVAKLKGLQLFPVKKIDDALAILQSLES